jgi:hypothetical protein
MLSRFYLIKLWENLCFKNLKAKLAKVCFRIWALVIYRLVRSVIIRNIFKIIALIRLLWNFFMSVNIITSWKCVSSFLLIFKLKLNLNI